MILHLTDKLGDELVGGKAGTLMRLTGSFEVPGGFVVTPDDGFQEANILGTFDEMAMQKVAVRSSAVNEDGTETAWAGQLETVLGVIRAGVVDAVRYCRSSSDSKRAKAYALAHQTTSGGVAVIVQRMLDSRLSGVAFSRHPVTGEKRVVVEVVEGLGEKLVSGLVTPDTYVLGGKKIIEQYIFSKDTIITPAELNQVSSLTLAVEEKLGYPVDIEWSFEGDVLFLLQARPITTL